MKISTKGRYATRALFDLAQRYGTGPVVLSEVARRQDISEQYLEHLISPLKNAGLVRSIRGALGGFMLAKLPSEIKISQIIRAVEGPSGITDCVDDPESCPRAADCPTRDVWAQATEAMDNVFSSITLADLVKRSGGKKQPSDGIKQDSPAPKNTRQK